MGNMPVNWHAGLRQGVYLCEQANTFRLLRYFCPCRDLLLLREPMVAVLRLQAWRFAWVFWPSFPE